MSIPRNIPDCQLLQTSESVSSLGYIAAFTCPDHKVQEQVMSVKHIGMVEFSFILIVQTLQLLTQAVQAGKLGKKLE